MGSLVYTPVRSSSCALHAPSWTSARKQAFLLALLLSFTVQWVGAVQNPLDDFCRRYGHQTTVIDDKLYIDGGWVDFTTFQIDHTDYPNTWLGYQDLNSLAVVNNEAWPQLYINLTKDPNVVPTVAGGVLWGDDINKKYYVYGGDSIPGLPDPFKLWSYDILYDRWNDLGALNISIPPNIASYGAGVGVSKTGQGYYYGGWVRNTSMYGWTQPQNMSSAFYTYEYDNSQFEMLNSPSDNFPRAEGVMVWIPAGDSGGLIVYFGGLVSPYGNATTAAQPLDEIFVYDPSTNAWYTQTAVGEIPENRRRFCGDVAWAPDYSSYNIYIWGGLSVPPPVPNVTALNNVYILSLPSFTWVKVSPDQHGNATFPNGHFSASCNMVKSNSQMLVIGGSYPDTDICDTAAYAWAQHNLWTGEKDNAGDANETYWALYSPNVSTNVVPADVYGVIGGDKNGGATLRTPKAGYDQGDSILSTLLTRTPTFTRTATRPTTTSTTTAPVHPSPPAPSPAAPSPGPSLATGAIVGIAIGGAVALGLILWAWIVLGSRVQRRRKERLEQRRQSQITYASYGHGSSSPAMMSPQSQTGHWAAAPVSPQYPAVPPTELPSQSMMTAVPVGEMAHHTSDDKAVHVSPVGVPSPAQSPIGTTSPGPEVNYS